MEEEKFNEVEVMTAKPDNKLLVTINQSGLETESKETLQKKFLPFYVAAERMKEQAEKIQVTDATQLTEMKQARELRLSLREVRINVEKERKALKEDSLKRGKVIDGVANVLKGLIEPIETDLELKEKFAEIQEQKRIDDREKIRNEKLVALIGIDASTYRVRDMTDEQFENLYKALEMAEKVKAEEAEKLRLAEIERQTKEKEERERIEAENKKLRDEQEKLRKENEAKERARQKELEAERAKAEELKRELAKQAKAKADAEKAEQEKIKAEEERLAKLEAAPDKEKLLKLIEDIQNIQLPDMKTKKAQAITYDVETLLNKVINHIQEKLNLL